MVVAELVAAGCGAAPPTTTAYRGTMRASCAPYDAPSTELRLESVGADDSVFFNLWPPSGVIPPAVVEFDARHPVGQGTYCTGPEDCQPAAWGKVALRNPAEGGKATIEGEWEIELADDRAFRGTFTAEWLAIQALCG
jgi:hypothetical protein